MLGIPKTPANCLRLLSGSLAAALLAAMTGCHSAPSSSAPPSAASVAAGKAQAIQNIRDNPQIPAQQKENIIKQIEGKAIPNAPPVTPPPK